MLEGWNGMGIDSKHHSQVTKWMVTKKRFLSGQCRDIHLSAQYNRFTGGPLHRQVEHHVRLIKKTTFYLKGHQNKSNVFHFFS